MKFIVILSCLALQHWTNFHWQLQSEWFDSYLRLFSRWAIKINRWGILGAIVLPLLLLLYILQLMFANQFFGLFNLLFTIIILFYCINARSLTVQLSSYFSSLAQGDLAAAEQALQLFSASTGHFDDTIESTNSVIVLDNDENNSLITESIGYTTNLYRLATKAILAKSLKELFVGLFWFVFAGVYGVVAYFVINLINQRANKVSVTYVQLTRLTKYLIELFNWLPARLLGFTFALTGDFKQVYHYLKKSFWSHMFNTNEFIVNIGLSAVTSTNAEVTEAENHEMIHLIERSLPLWIVFISLLLI